MNIGRLFAAVAGLGKALGFRHRYLISTYRVGGIEIT